MYDVAYVGKENAVEFFEKVCIDNDSDNFDFIDAIPFEIESSPSFYTANYRKKRGYRRTVTKNRFRGQRDGEYSLSHENRYYNNLCKKAVSESRSSVIKRGYDDYLDDIEEQKNAEEVKKAKEIANEIYKANLIEERNEAALTIMICAAKIDAIDTELAAIASE